MIISCMDARVSPEKYLDLNLGDAFVYRDGGGSATGAIRSIVAIDSVVQLESLILVRHKDCGVIGWDDEKIRKILSARAPDRAEEIDKMTFGKFKEEEQSIKDDVAFLTTNTLLRKELRDNTFGYLLDIKTGLIEKVA
ncbi:hypothetical protein V502_10982 [Pseudogymnoascus sp. VKM F-4520 (FW-2644)]|nr:hypothetical protein V502_10982 [Pseudogymnoascus sp. VKM F-4520 (FW-2644)]